MEANNSEVYQLKQTIAECEKRRPGLLVWGIILLVTGLVMLGLMELIKRLLWDLDIINDFDSPVPGIIIGVWIVGSLAMILAFILGSAARKRHGEEATQRLQEVLRSSSGSPMSTPSYGAAPTYGAAPMNNTGYGAAPTYGSAPMNNTGYGAAPTYPTQPTYDPNPAPTYTAPEQTYEAPAWNPAPAPAPEKTYEAPAWNPEPAPEQTYAMPTWESTSTPVAEPAPAPEPVHSFDSLYDSAWNSAGTAAPEAASNPGSESNPESPKGFKPVGRF